jgi:NAD(P)-dependent dehydrogenase (short-subunit alcohol dehydrogenase family)
VIATGREVDVRNQDDLFAFLGRTREDGPIRNLIYSAGITKLDWSIEASSEDMLNIYHINVVGLINVLQMLPMVRRVVVIGSDAAWREMRTSVSYCASKAALHQAVRVIARERASDEFAINVVAPGMTEPTDMQAYVDKEVPRIRGWSPEAARDYETSQIPMERRAGISEIASVAVAVLLMPTNYLNGAIIPVNGGR